MAANPLAFDDWEAEDSPRDSAFVTKRQSTHLALAANLSRLHGQDIAALAKLRPRLTLGEQSYISIVYEDVVQWLCFLTSTWGDVLKSMGPIVMGDLGFQNIVVLVVFAFGASVVMTIMLPICLFMKSPPVRLLYGVYVIWRRGERPTVVNARGHMFTELSNGQAKDSRAALSAPPYLSPLGTASFDLDVAKLLLQLASLMYERSAVQKHTALRETLRTSSDRTDSTFASDLEFANLAKHHGTKSEADGIISNWSKMYKIEYHPASELNAESSAYAALFWPQDLENSPESRNWIVCAFKGTSPTEYTEWVWDFTYKFKYAGNVIPGFNKVHKGFLERLFNPKRHHDSGARKGDQTPPDPYDAIASSIQEVAAHLRGGTNKVINVYFTGHSLGCGIASLAYARALAKEKEDFGPGICIRDAYLFAAPIVCDPESVKAFNELAVSDTGLTRMLWRVTNGEDAVATMLPAFGDLRSRSSAIQFTKNSPINFAHLGAELRMRTKPTPSLVGGSLLAPTAMVQVRSELDATSVGNVPRARGLTWCERGMQKLPLVGRLVQHGTAFYWDQLQRIGTGTCSFVE